MRLPLTEHCQAWVKNLPIFLVELDNSVTQLLDISFTETQKKNMSLLKFLSHEKNLLGLMSLDYSMIF
jgi:hypothetical protein